MSGLDPSVVRAELSKAGDQYSLHLTDILGQKWVLAPGSTFVITKYIEEVWWVIIFPIQRVPHFYTKLNHVNIYTKLRQPTFHSVQQ